MPMPTMGSSVTAANMPVAFKVARAVIISSPNGKCAVVKPQLRQRLPDTATTHPVQASLTHAASLPGYPPISGGAMLSQPGSDQCRCCRP